jgi:Concanavalin A-like lectin/glucanases superfamily
MAAYPDSYKILAYLPSEYDLTPDCIKNNIEGEWGINGVSGLDILADTGSLDFTLNNLTQKYTINSASALSGWDKSIPVCLIITFQGEDYHRFYGTLDSIKYNDEDYTVDCSVTDWIDKSATNPMPLPSTVINQTADQALNTIVSAMPIQPKNKYFEVGNSNFNIVFDSTSETTKAYSEFAKLCNSEGLGRVYLQKDKTSGETLVFENKNHRNGLNTLNKVIKSKGDSSALINSTGGRIKNSSGGKILIKQYQDLFFDNIDMDISPTFSDGVINSLTVTANPKTFDSGSSILFSLSQPVFVGSMQTVDFYGNYVDSSGKSCNALTSTMIQPLVNTDFSANTSQTGSGVDISASLVCSAQFGSAQVHYTSTNNSVYPGWITKMTARGTGIHNFTQISALEESQASINKYSYQSQSLNQDYQVDLVNGTQLIRSIVESEKKPRTKFEEVTFLANTSDFMMLAFLNIDIGSLVRIKDDRYLIDGYFYVQKIKFTIEMGGIIMFSLGLKRAFSLLLGLSLAACTFHANSTDAICFGNLPSVIDLQQMSLSAWVYPTNFSTTNLDILSGWVSGVGGLEFQLTHPGGYLALTRIYSTSGGRWVSDALHVTANQWNYVVVTTDATNNIVKMYINGISDNADVVTPPVGTLASINGMDFCIGNIHDQASDTNFSKPFIGSIKDTRIYNRILTQDEITSLYNGGSVTNGLVFQSPCIRTDDTFIYNGATLTSETKLLDNVFGAVGTPNGSPTCSIP